jgi:hypothetical protein
VVPIILTDPKHFPQPLRIRDVIADDVGVAHPQKELKS